MTIATLAAGSDPRRGLSLSVRRVGALVRRHAYLLLKSWPRIVSMAYYPTVTMVLWAFVTLYLAPTNRFLTDAPGFFIGAVLLWDVLFRGQLGVSLTSAPLARKKFGRSQPKREPKQAPLAASVA